MKTIETKEQRKASFRKYFERLFQEHGAEFEYDSDSRMLTITMWTKYDEDDRLEKELCEFDLPAYYNP